MQGKGHCAELNMEPSAGKSLFHEHLYGKATEIVPAYIKRLTGGDFNQFRSVS